MKILITGAFGAIGIHLVKHILENTDWKIIATDSFRHKGYTDRVTAMDIDLSRVDIITHDLTVPFTSRQIDALRGTDYIVNLASLSDVGDSIIEPVSFIKNNVDITLNMLELAREIKPKTFIQFSTDEVYGPDSVDGKGHPEWDVILPSNPYSASKSSQEAIAIAYWRSYGVPVVITNTMNNFGETQGASKYTAMIQKKLEAGEKITVHVSSDGQLGTRYYLHSRNAADAILFILNNLPAYQHKAGEIDRPDRYNIVGDIQLDNLELAQRVADLMGKELNYELVDFHSDQSGHDLHYGLNGNKLAKAGWKAPKGFDDSMSETIEWQRRHPEWLS